MQNTSSSGTSIRKQNCPKLLFRKWQSGFRFQRRIDTTFCVKYFTEEKGYEVHSIIVNTGGFTEEELKQIEKHAYSTWCKNTYYS